MKTKTTRLSKAVRIGAVASALAFSSIANAAFLSIDDSDVNNITITAGDFENGLTVNGSLLTSGLGNSGSVTLADGGYNLSGSWIDLGLSSGSLNIFFALSGAPTGVTSGLALNASSDGSNGTINGSFGGFLGSRYFTGSPTFLQDGHTESGSFPFLSISFKSEASAVPEPGSLALLGIALAGLTAVRRRPTKA